MDRVASAQEQFDWTVQPTAAALVREFVEDFCRRCPAAAALAASMRERTGTRLIDWVDHFDLPQSKSLDERLSAAGFVRTTAGEGLAWNHPAGLFPTICTHPQDVTRLAIKTESVADFLAAQSLNDHTLTDGTPIEGPPVSPLRQARIALQQQCELWAIERHGERNNRPATVAPEKSRSALEHLETFRRRQRHFPRDADGFAHAEKLIRAAERDLGRDWACDLFFAAEREFWQRRNRAAQVQKARQDVLGLGWANHDHHTFRSSREHFTRLIAVLELMGFECRERFYGGREAGWGAQVLEQPACDIVIFADVDLAPEEVTGDFAHEPLPPQDKLGTVGLWCQLHGEAFLQAGMHHLECRFDFALVQEQLRSLGVNTMKPFTDFPYLKQAFTQADLWPVAPERIDALVAAGRISAEEAARFRQQGALGSHLEILQRDDGYKGFNQTGINEIIKSTDPRRAAATGKEIGA